MRNKAVICTLYGNENFGNKLQNYALQLILEHYNLRVGTIKTDFVKFKLFRTMKNCVKFFFPRYHLSVARYIKFTEFNSKYIKYIRLKKYYSDSYSIFGSDQIWNPTIIKNYPIYLDKISDKMIAYAASFGVCNIPGDLIERYKKGMENFNSISVREDSGKKIVEQLTNNVDIKVLVDPTMLLTSSEWDGVSKEPKQYSGEKYILSYFLGKLNDNRRKSIEEIAKKMDCKIINILDKEDPYYVSGPSEFLWLEKHAELICTDSFHSCVFAFLFDRPFVVFDREQNKNENMGSRIDTLLNKFMLKDRRYNGKSITSENLNHDYSNGYDILENERKKSDLFLKKALNIEESDRNEK